MRGCVGGRWRFDGSILGNEFLIGIIFEYYFVYISVCLYKKENCRHSRRNEPIRPQDKRLGASTAAIARCSSGCQYKYPINEPGTKPKNFLFHKTRTRSNDPDHTHIFLRAAVYRACVRVGGALKSPVRGGKSRRPVVVVPLSGQVVSRRPAIHSLARSRPSLRAEAVRWTVSGRLAARNVSMKEMFGKYVHGSEISKCCQETS